MDRVTFRYPVCRADVLAPASLQGEALPCPKCEADVDRWPAPLTKALAPMNPPPPPKARWHYMQDQQQRGSVTDSQLRALAE